MPTSIDVSQATQDQSKLSSKARLRTTAGRYWLCAIFALALAVRLWFAFADGHSAIVYSCDASEYLRDARGLAQLFESPDRARIFQDAFQSLLDRTATGAGLRQGFEPVRELAIAGPIFPLFLLLSHAAFGLPITQLNWQAPVLFQCILSAFTCVLIAWIGKSAWHKNIGTTAGIIAAFYPGFIVNSMRMYSETFSCLLLCAVVALTVPVVKKSGMFHSIATGICLAFLQLTRSIMILVTGLTFALTAWFSTGKSRILRTLGLVVGLAIVFAPWLLFQQLAFNKSSVVVDRVGHYNLFIGTNITTQGYLSYPYPDGKDIEKRSYPSLIGAQVKESPERFVRLMLDKPLRLFKFPWNDFRTPIGPIGIDVQVIFHQLALVFSAIGLALCLIDKAPTEGRANQLRLTLAGLWAMHCVYLIFITVPRYNLTAIPFLILFAAAGFNTVVSAIGSKRTETSPEQVLSKPLAIALCCAVVLAMACARLDWFGTILAPLGTSDTVSIVVAGVAKTIALLFFFGVLYRASNRFAHTHQNKLAKVITATTAIITIPLCALPLRSHGRVGETVLKSPVSSNSAEPEVKQTILIPESRRAELGARDYYLLIDCENWQAIGNGAQLLVDGVELDGAATPIMPFAQRLSETKARQQKANIEQRYLECEDIYSSLTAAAGGGNLDLRQWFAVSIPRTIMTAALAQSSPQLVISVKRNSSIASAFYATFVDKNEKNVRIPSVARFSWEKAFYGVENEDGFTDSRYDDKIPVQSPPGSSTDSDTTSTKSVTPNIRLLIAAPASKTSLTNGQSTVLAVSDGKERVSLTDAQIPACDANTLWLASVRGKVSSTKPTAENLPISFAAIFESIDTQGMRHRYRSPWVPTSVVSNTGTSEFQFAFPFQPSGLPGKLTSISIEPRAGGPAARNDFLSVHNRFKTRISAGELEKGHRIDSLKLELHNLPANPIGFGHEVL